MRTTGPHTVDSFIGENTAVTCTYTYMPGDPGVTSGPPERCYPPEPEELKIRSVLLGGIEISAHLSEADMDLLTERLLDKEGERQEAANADAADFAYQQSRDEPEWTDGEVAW